MLFWVGFAILKFGTSKLLHLVISVMGG